jgi:hypothetical protein
VSVLCFHLYMRLLIFIRRSSCCLYICMFFRILLGVRSRFTVSPPSLSLLGNGSSGCLPVTFSMRSGSSKESRALFPEILLSLFSLLRLLSSGASIVKMGAARPSETSVNLYQTMPRHVPEENSLNSHRSNKLGSYKPILNLSKLLLLFCNTLLCLLCRFCYADAMLYVAGYSTLIINDKWPGV